MGGSVDVPQGAGGQPRRDRDPGLPRRVRARRRDGGGLPGRGPQLRAPAQGRRGVPDRRGGPPGPGLPLGPGDDRRRPAGRRRRDLSRLRLPLGEPRSGRRRATRPASPSSARPRACSRWPATRPARSRRPARPGVPVLDSSDPSDDVDTLVAAAGAMAFPLFVKAVAGGGGRGMRLRARGVGACGSRCRGGDARGGVGVRRRHRLPRAGGGRPAAHRGADPRRRRRATSCTSSSGTARCSAGTRRSSRSRPRRTCRAGAARADLRGRGALRDADRLRQRGHRRVPARRRRQPRLHRDEPAHPGGAHGHRGGHRRRPGRGADADRVGATPSPISACPRTRSRCTGSRCSAGSPPRTRPTSSARTSG